MASNYGLLFGTDTIRRITAETEAQLKQMKLWKNNEDWSPAIMRQLALGDFHILDFEQVAYSVKQMAKSRMVELMNEYTLSLKHVPHIKDALEYASIFRQTAILKQLLERHQNDEKLTDWMPTYRLLLQVLEGKLSHGEIVDEACNLDAYVQDPVLKLRLKLLAAGAYSQLDQFKETSPLLESIIDEFDGIKTGYTRSALASRTLLLVGNYFLYGDGDIEKAEKNYLAVDINLATPPSMKSAANHGLGLIMMRHNNRVQCRYYFEEAIREAKESGQHDYYACLMNEYYPFARNIMGETFDLKGVVSEERVHQHIVRGEREKAIRVIEELEAAGKDSPFLTWYKGKATGNIEFLNASLKVFEAQNRAYLVPIIHQERSRISSLGGGV
ncbi:AimR family lysis-lysogeny pheromone receptor [Bacillus sp. FSL W7-1360]